MAGFVEKTINAVTFMTSGAIGTAHAFTTRLGGVSTGSFSSLNLGAARGDDPECVRENYRRLGSALGLPSDGRFVFSRQVHGNAVRTVTYGDALEPLGAVPYEADALVTNQRQLPLIIFTADCVPVLLHDPIHSVIGAVHCGWRSTVADILGATVESMKKLGASPEDIRAAIGPAICERCFETGPEVPEAVRALLGADAAEALISPRDVPGKFLVALKGVNRVRLVQLGLSPDNIGVSDECTMCNADRYWSHRVHGAARGSQASVIMIN